MRIWLAIVAIFISSSSWSQNTAKVANSIRIKHQIPELAYAVVTADKVIEQAYLGHHKFDQFTVKDTARSTDYFHLGSNTKAITGFIAAYLVERGKIKWSTKVFELFPNWKKQSDAAYYNVTLENLLSHRAHIQPYTSGLEYQELPRFVGSKAAQRQNFAEYLLREKPVKGDAVYNYSNAGYSIAAAMLEKATGNTWEQLVEHVINKTLGLHARFGWPNKISANEPWGHLVENNKLTAVPATTDYNLALAEPAGDICMTLPDYIKLMQLNLMGLNGKDNVLKASTFFFLHYGLRDYAIGWGNVVSKSIKESSHAGSAGTYYCYTLVDGIKHKSYIIMTNSATEATEKGVDALLAILKKQ